VRGWFERDQLRRTWEDRHALTPRCPRAVVGRTQETLARRVDPCSTILVSAPEQSKLPTGIRPGEGVADPRYLLAEVTELRDIAERAGLGTLAYALECARLECVWLVEHQEQAERRS
jgi:hypothetical protein